MQFVKEEEPAKTAPPLSPAEFPLKVQFVKEEEWEAKIAPPISPAEFWLKVQFVKEVG